MEITQWLQEQIAEETGIKIEDISCDEEFENFDLDSLSLLSLSFELENLIKKELSPTVFSEYNTINKLVEWANQKTN